MNNKLSIIFDDYIAFYKEMEKKYSSDENLYVVNSLLLYILLSNFKSTKARKVLFNLIVKSNIELIEKAENVL